MSTIPRTTPSNHCHVGCSRQATQKLLLPTTSPCSNTTNSTSHMVHRIQYYLFKHHSKLSKSQLRRRLEKWDRDQGRATRHAEKLLTRQHQKYYWSPTTLRNAGLVCCYWHLRLYGIRKNRDMSTSIFRLQNHIRQHNPDFMFPPHAIRQFTRGGDN